MKFNFEKLMVQVMLHESNNEMFCSSRVNYIRFVTTAFWSS
jgi:hypothetical protein